MKYPPYDIPKPEAPAESFDPFEVAPWARKPVDGPVFHGGSPTLTSWNAITRTAEPGAEVFARRMGDGCEERR